VCLDWGRWGWRVFRGGLYDKLYVCRAGDPIVPSLFDITEKSAAFGTSLEADAKTYCASATSHRLRLSTPQDHEDWCPCKKICSS
jgi:hypothetical protein